MTTVSHHERDIKLFERFIGSGYAKAKFTKDLYRALYLSSFGFIAHYDLDGFYAARFGGWPERAETLAQVLECDARTPLDAAVQEYVRSEGLLDKAKRAAAEELEAGERAELGRLKAKYEAP